MGDHHRPCERSTSAAPIVTAAITNDSADELKLARQDRLCGDQGERRDGGCGSTASRGRLHHASRSTAPPYVARRRSLRRDAAGAAALARAARPSPTAPAARCRCPAKVARVFPAGPPAAILLYTLAPGPAARLAARQPPRGVRVPAAGRLAPPGGRPHHRPRQHRQSRGRAGAQARPHPRRRRDQPDLRVARRPRAGADRHPLCAARRPLRRDRARPTASSAS